jgi:2-beta-glucuronyltransferase
MHFVAAELAKRGKTRFFSIGFSPLSYLKMDSRMPVAPHANRVESEDGVDCFLWKTAWHPCNLRLSVAQPLERALFRAYRLRLPPVLRQWMAEATVILFESGLSPIFIGQASQINPHAELIYVASDDLTTLGCASFIRDELKRTESMMSGVWLPSKKLRNSFHPDSKLFYVPHGIDPSIARDADPSPYGDGLHAVSVGSMLFDPRFFEIAAASFPEITFHVIGPGRHGAKLVGPNIRVYGEMRFRDTLPYIKHATFGVAPYKDADVPEYLVDTSMKLMQYGFFGLPAVCPDYVAGGHRGRVAYRPGDSGSIKAAIRAALAFGRLEDRQFLTWGEVADRVLSPAMYPDTAMSVGCMRHTENSGG